MTPNQTFKFFYNPDSEYSIIRFFPFNLVVILSKNIKKSRSNSNSAHIYWCAYLIPIVSDSLIKKAASQKTRLQNFQLQISPSILVQLTSQTHQHDHGIKLCKIPLNMIFPMSRTWVGGTHEPAGRSRSSRQTHRLREPSGPRRQWVCRLETFID